MTNRPTAQEIIEGLHLAPLDREGGMFRSTYRTKENVNGQTMGSAIYFFLTKHAFSHMHRLPKDEVYHFYLGDPVDLLELLPDGTARTVTIGADIQNGQQPQVVVRAGSWQGSRVADGGEYALMGTTMSPGFEPNDYEHADAQELIRQYPAAAEWIERLTGDTLYQ